MDASRYPAQVFWSDEDEGFIALAPDLTGCSAWGETQEEALVELQNAIAAWVDAARKAGNTIPAPSSPASDSQYSGKLLVRMPSALHAELVRGAKREGVSLNHYAVFLLTKANTAHGFETNLNKRVEEIKGMFVLIRQDTCRRYVSTSDRLCLSHFNVKGSQTATTESLGHLYRAF